MHRITYIGPDGYALLTHDVPIGTKILVDGEAVMKKKAHGGKKEDGYPKHIGGGYYELSDGSQLKGKAAANAAQSQL